MKVKELIEILKGFDQELTVMEAYDGDFYHLRERDIEVSEFEDEEIVSIG